MAEIVSTMVTDKGDTVVIHGDSLAAAGTNTKGAVKKGASVAKGTRIDDSRVTASNDLIQSLRKSGSLDNTKYRVLYYPNFPAGNEDEEAGKRSIPEDKNIYETGDSATILFQDDEGNYPNLSGYNFRGWALSPSSSVPDYPAADGGSDQTVTFTNDDIILYAVWEEVSYTLTYALGSYGQGSVPAPQTVKEGESVIISFSPAPTVNDGSGRVFVGWANDDGEDSYMNAAHSADNAGESVYLYQDITLYPVFCYQYTLTYALGNDATGTVPSSVSAYNGESVSLDFNPSVTCVSDNTKVFIGWSYTDESGSADFTADSIHEIYMSGNVTLYPVFGTQAAGNTITIDATGSAYDILVSHYDSDDDITVTDKTIHAGSSDTFTFSDAVDQYQIEFDLQGESQPADALFATFTGSYNGTGYQDEPLTVGDEYYINKVTAPDGGDWMTTSNPSGTLTVYTGGM